MKVSIAIFTINSNYVYILKFDTRQCNTFISHLVEKQVDFCVKS